MTDKKPSSRREYTLNIQKIRSESVGSLNLDNIELERQLGLGSDVFKTYIKTMNERFVSTEISLKNHDIELYIEWKSHFSEIYHDENLEMDLFFRHSYLVLICNCAKKVLEDIIHSICNESDISRINIPYLEEINRKQFPFLIITEDKSTKQNPTISFLTGEITTIISQFLSISKDQLSVIKRSRDENNLFDTINHILIEKGDLFNLLYQDLILPTQRHKIGEFYTPIPLVELMVNEVYHLNGDVLDPACGTATFLVEIIKKICLNGLNNLSNRIEAISEIFKNLYRLKGIELNPLTASVAVLNIFSIIIHLVLILRSANLINIHDIPAQKLYELSNIIVNDDFLLANYDVFNTKNNWTSHKYDLIIGNPPWLVINGIHSKFYKEKAKKLAKDFDINTNKQNTSNLEISSIFIAKSVHNHLKQNGCIAFVLSAGILTGSQNDRLREFKGMKDISFWRFDKDIFNIHNICMFAKKGTDNPHNKYKISIETKICVDNPITIKSGVKELYVPQYFQYNDKNYQIDDLKSIDLNNVSFGRLIPESEITERISPSKSKYHDLFRQGACLGPRNLIFSQNLSIIDPTIIKEYLTEGMENSFEEIIKKIEYSGKDNIIIKPDPDIEYKAYSNWDFRAYEYALIHHNQIFQVAKTTDLIPFLLLKTTQIFLPINLWQPPDGFLVSDHLNKSNLQDIEELFEKDSHYKFLNEIYQDKLKSGGSIDSLFKNMNHNNKMLNHNQLGLFKIVYNGIGSIVKASLVKGNILMDSSLYYLNPKSEEEAYYLLGVLNTPEITKQVERMGSTGSGGSLRNIHKNPLNIPIPEYIDNILIRKIIQLSKDIESYVLAWVIEFLQSTLSITLTNKAICPFCERTITKEQLESHIVLCKQSNPSDYALYAILFNMLSTEEIKHLFETQVLHDIIGEKNYFKEATSIDFNQLIKSSVIIHGLLKPKTIQKALFKNKAFLSRLEGLNSAVNELLVNEVKNE